MTDSTLLLVDFNTHRMIARNPVFLPANFKLLIHDYMVIEVAPIADG